MTTPTEPDKKGSALSAGPGLVVLWVTKWCEDSDADCYYKTRTAAEDEVEFYRNDPEWSIELGPVRREVHPRSFLREIEWDRDR